MFCPSCGEKNSTDQRFCRSCGLNLEPAAQSLIEQMGSGYIGNPTDREQMLESFGKFAFGGFLVVLSLGAIGILYVILDWMVLSGRQPLMGLVLMSFIVFAILSLAYVILRENLNEKRTSVKRAAPEELQSPAVTGRLLHENQFEPVPAVTENTTDLLPTHRRDG